MIDYSKLKKSLQLLYEQNTRIRSLNEEPNPQH